MPAPVLKSYQKKSGKSGSDMERYWNEAKEAAKKKGLSGDHFWAYVNSITKRRAGLGSIQDERLVAVLNQFPKEIPRAFRKLVQVAALAASDLSHHAAFLRLGYRHTHSNPSEHGFTHHYEHGDSPGGLLLHNHLSEHGFQTSLGAPTRTRWENVNTSQSVLVSPHPSGSGHILQFNSSGIP